MRVLFQMLFLLLAAVVQVAVLSHLTGDVNVDLVLLIVVAWGMIKGVQAGLLWGMAGGLILDLLSAAPFGTTMALLALVGLFGGLRPFPFLRRSALSAIVIAGVATILYHGLAMAVLALFGWQWQWLETLSSVVIPVALLNAGAMLPVYWLLCRFHRDPDKFVRNVARYV